MKVLLIEDEASIGNAIIDFLSFNNILVEWVKELSAAQIKLDLYKYDCIILDLMLPDGSGETLIETIKEYNRNEGILILSAKDSLLTKIDCLNLGADDFLTKPFHLAELQARLNAIYRRKQFEGNTTIQFNEIELDLNSKSILINKNEVAFTKTEFEMILFFIGNKKRVLSKSTIAEHITGDQADQLISHDFIYSHIKNIKKKLMDNGVTDYIKTIYGLGYKWEE